MPKTQALRIRAAAEPPDCAAASGGKTGFGQTILAITSSPNRRTASHFSSTELGSAP